MFLMVLVKLWRLPPRLGGERMTADQLNTEIQLDRTSGWVNTSLSNPAKCEAQAARADFGMCLIACTVGGDQKPLTVGDAVVFPDGVSLVATGGCGVGWFRQAVDCVTASNGGLFEPGHGLSRGPCL